MTTDGIPWLARGIDPAKDQSYFLYRLTPTQLDHVLFPVGELEKPAVRAIAERMGLHVAEKPDSQEVCFASAGQHAQVVGERHPEALIPGEIVTSRGDVVGRHSGIAGYTVGQRKGLGVSAATPLYVLAVDAKRNRIVVGGRDELAVTQRRGREVVWRGEPTSTCEAMIRYRMTAAGGRAAFSDGRLSVTFPEPIHGVAPGQAVVCYSQDLVIGGGTVTCAS